MREGCHVRGMVDDWTVEYNLSSLVLDPSSPSMVWQSFVRNWLQQQVRQKAYQTVSEAAQARAAGEGTGTASLPLPCDVGLVFALGIESGGFEDLLTGVMTTRGVGFVAKQGLLQGRGIVLIESGVGTLAAARGTQALLAGHKPPWVISTGFAGALVPQLKRCDILMVDSLTEASDRRLAIDLRVNAESLTRSPGVHVGRLVTVDTIVHTPEEKRALGRRHEALAVDMESWAVGEVCRQAKTRFMAVRIISDGVDDELPRDVERLARQKSRAARLGAAAGAIFRRPSSVKDMLQLKEDALVASDRLATFLAGMIVQLVPPPPAP
jgi:adenosylhomocysteine nucleosidase